MDCCVPMTQDFTEQKKKCTIFCCCSLFVCSFVFSLSLFHLGFRPEFGLLNAHSIITSMKHRVNNNYNNSNSSITIDRNGKMSKWTKSGTKIFFKYLYCAVLIQRCPRLFYCSSSFLFFYIRFGKMLSLSYFVLGDFLKRLVKVRWYLELIIEMMPSVHRAFVFAQYDEARKKERNRNRDQTISIFQTK